MRRNCNLELRLVPPSISHFSDDHHLHHHQQPMIRLMEGISEPTGQDQQLTIFYNGRVCFCDVTELQARAIILHASQGVEVKSKSEQGKGSDEAQAEAALLMASQLLGSCSPPSAGNGISLKRSLQRFLQNRMHRIQSTSPYQQHH